MKPTTKQWSWIAVLGTAVTVGVNALANILPINGITSGARSDMYENLFAPAGFTFSVWGVIYTLLIAYTLWQLWLVSTKPRDKRVKLVAQLNPLYVATCAINSVWILAWHYNQIWLSMVLIISLLVVLIRIAAVLRSANVSGRDRLWLQAPFSVYFGWITVATIANITTWLVSAKWDGAGVSPEHWMMMLIPVATIIACAGVLRNRDCAYGAVILWAFYGILAKHLPSGYWGGKYPGVIITVAVMMCVLLVLTGYVFAQRMKNR